MPIEVDVVEADVQFLGLDWIDKFELYLGATGNVFVSSPENVSMKVVRNFGHIYFDWKEA